MGKTAMTQLKEKLEIKLIGIALAETKQTTEHMKSFDRGQISILEDLIKDIDSQMIAIEKEQITDAYLYGHNNTLSGTYLDYEHYYPQTFEK